MADETIHCRRCGKDAPRLARPPFRNELGERIAAEICADCWKDWLQHQTLLINHYGLDPRDAKARAFLYEQIEQVLLRDEAPEQVDTSQKGNIEW
jgi:Fe-S cluster biosynthesis and repair protein YggX